MGLALLLQQATTQSAPTASELQNQIRQTVREATEAARQAAIDANAARAQAQGASGHRIVLPLPPTPPSLGTETGTSFDRDMPPRVKDVSLAFFAMIALIVIGLPLVRALARRIDKGTQAPPAIPKEVRDQLQQISQSVDAIAIEVERISEGQRFTTRMLADKRPQDITMFTPGSTGQ